jgi:glycosyltransferase involved in cell wall biosynthesis
MSVLEAYACGKPVIGARIAGIPEMVHDGVTGALFESGNVDELAALLAHFSAMPNEQISVMGEAARTYVSTTFTAERYMREMLALYADLGVRIDAPDHAKAVV